VDWISDSIIMTYGLDKEIKFWDFQTEELLMTVKVSELLRKILP